MYMRTSSRRASREKTKKSFVAAKNNKKKNLSILMSKRSFIRATVAPATTTCGQCVKRKTETLERQNKIKKNILIIYEYINNGKTTFFLFTTYLLYNRFTRHQSEYI